MLNDDICKKRDELNQSIAENKDYSIIYRLSVELDQLIAEFYNIVNKIAVFPLFFIRYNSIIYAYF